MILKINHLIPAVKKRERKAQKALVELISPFLYTICKRYTKTEEDAKDVLQESLILMFKNIDQFHQNGASFKGWVRRISINVALGRFRKFYNVKELYPGELQTNNFYEAKILDQLNVNDILDLLDSLPAVQKQVFNLFVIDGYKHLEIAKLLGVEPSYSRTILVRARKKMQELIIESKKIRS